MALDFGKLNFSTSFNPTAAFPLDARCYFESLTAAQTAVASAEAAGDSTTVYFFGQQVAVVENNVATLYIVEKVTDETTKGYHGGLKEVGSKTLGDQSSIDLTNGILTIHGFSTAANKNVPYKDTETGKIVWGPVEGLIPSAIVPVGDGKTIVVAEDTQDPNKRVISILGATGAATGTVMRKKANGDFEWVVSYSKAEVDTELAKKVDVVTGKSLVDDSEITKLEGVSAGANKVEASTTNGNIKIDGTETTVYTEVAGTVHDANYKHITVTNTSVSDGTNTFNKYDDTALAGRVTTAEGKIDTLETTVGDSSSGLVKGLADEITARTTADSGLDERIRNLESRGRFLSNWNAGTGLPTTYPTIPEGASSPYTYTFKSGDYYIVGSVPASGTVYVPSGSSISATKSGETWTWTIGKTTTTDKVSVGDQFVYDGTTWTHIAAAKDTAWGTITGTLTDQTDLKNALDAKQDAITATNKLDADLVVDGPTNKVYTATEKIKLARITAEANKVTVTTEKSGNIEIDGVSKQVIPDNIAIDADYKHITVTSTSVSDGTTTFNKYDDSTLSGKVTALETKVGQTGETPTGLYKAISDEAAARTAADTTLQTNIDAEKTRAEGIESGLRTDVDAKLAKADLATEVAKLDIQASKVKVDSTTTLTSKLSTMDTAIEGKVDKVEGKGLSTNDLTNELKSGYDTAASQTHTHGNKSTLDNIGADNLLDTTGSDATKAKLTGIEAGAQVNKIEHIKLNGSDVTIDDDKRVDLGSIATSAELTTLAGRVSAVESGKVDKVTGKGLSTKDYTAEDQTKLAGIEAGAEVNIIETVKVDGTALIPDANRAVNVDLSGKVDKETGKGLSTNDYTTAEKTKLAGISDGANKVESSTENGYIKIDGTATKVFDDTNLVPKTRTIAGVDLADNITDTELRTALNVVDGATKVEASTTNGNIKINGTETTVYTLPDDVVKDSTYKHITVSATDGVTAGSGASAVTYKYDDTAVKADIATNTSHIGTLTNLTTDVKTDLVSAVNEVDAHADANATAISAEETRAKAAEALLIPLSQKGAADGVATLGSDSKIPTSQLPDFILGQLLFGGTFDGNGIATISGNLKSKLAITDSTIQLINSATDDKTQTPKEYGYKTLEAVYFIADATFTIAEIEFQVGDWLVSIGTAWKKIKNTDAVTGVKGDAESSYRIGNVNITKANIGLGNVDNTSDLNKPISTATQTALDLKADKSTTYTKTEVDTALSGKADKATTLAGYGITDAYTKTEVDTSLANKVDTYVEGSGTTGFGASSGGEDSVYGRVQASGMTGEVQMYSQFSHGGQSNIVINTNSVVTGVMNTEEMDYVSSINMNDSSADVKSTTVTLSNTTGAVITVNSSSKAYYGTAGTAANEIATVGNVEAALTWGTIPSPTE